MQLCAGGFAAAALFSTNLQAQVSGGLEFEVSPPAGGTTLSPAAVFHYGDPLGDPDTYDWTLSDSAGGTVFSATGEAKDHVAMVGLRPDTYTFTVVGYTNGMASHSPISTSWTVEAAVTAADAAGPAYYSSKANLTFEGNPFPHLGIDPWLDASVVQTPRFVSPNGVTDGVGPIEAPLNLTSALGLARVSPSDETLVLLPGDYGSFTVAPGTNRDITVIGTPGAVISGGGGDLLASITREGTVLHGLELDCSFEDNNLMTPNGVNGVRVDAGGVVIDSCFLHDTPTYSLTAESDDAITILKGGDGTIVQNCEIMGFVQGAANATGDLADCQGVVVRGGGGDIDILGCHIHDMAGDAIQFNKHSGTGVESRNSTISGNVIHDNRENAFDVKGCELITFQNNLVYGHLPMNTAGYSANCAVRVHYDVKAVTIRNNHFHSNGMSTVAVNPGANKNGSGSNWPLVEPRLVKIHNNFIDGNALYDFDEFVAANPNRLGHLTSLVGSPEFKAVTYGSANKEIHNDLRIFNNLMLDWETGINLNLSLASDSAVNLENAQRMLCAIVNNAFLVTQDMPSVGEVGPRDFVAISASLLPQFYDFWNTCYTGSGFDGNLFLNKGGNSYINLSGQPAVDVITYFATNQVDDPISPFGRSYPHRALQEWQAGSGASTWSSSDVTDWILPWDMIGSSGFMELVEAGYTSDPLVPLNVGIEKNN